jgi:ABC-type multidrug transport system permease subunit
MFQLFDDVLLLAKGHVVYNAKGADAAQTMAAQGTPCPIGYNIADHLLDVATVIGTEIPLVVLDDTKKSTLSRMFRKPSTQPRQVTDVESAEPITSLSSSENDEYTPQQVSFLTQLIQLSRRSAKILYRDPSLLLSHIAASIILGLFIGGLYFKSDSSLAGFQNFLGSAFFLLSIVGYSSMSAIASFNEERQLYLRERSNGFYNSGAFFVTKVVFDLFPLRILPTFLMGTISFFMIGIESAIYGKVSLWFNLVVYHHAFVV